MNRIDSQQGGFNRQGDSADGSEGLIFDIKKYAIHDGPGIRTTVFFKGCPLRCSWCHNPESWLTSAEPGFRAGRCGRCGRCVQACTAGAVSINGGLPGTDIEKCVLCGECVSQCPEAAREIIGRYMTAEQVMARIEKDVVFYDESGGGATFSGGEPLMQPAFLMRLLEMCRARAIHTAVDTCCYCEPQVLADAAGLADMFLCDIKHMDSAKHRQFTGVDNRLILDNISNLCRMGCKVVIRMPIVPGFNDDGANIEAVSDFVASVGAERIDVLPFNRAGRDKSARLARETEMIDAMTRNDEVTEAIAETMRARGLRVGIGG